MKMNNLSIDQKFSFSLILSYPIRKIIKNRLTLFKIIRGIIITENSNFVEKDERGKRWNGQKGSRVNQKLVDNKAGN